MVSGVFYGAEADLAIARSVELLEGEEVDLPRIYVEDDLLWPPPIEHLDKNRDNLCSEAENTGPVVGYEDDGCSNEESWRFDSFEELKAFDGTEDEEGKKVFFGSYHTLKQPEYCYALASQDEMETIIVIGRRPQPLVKPLASAWSYENQTRRIWAQPQGFSTWQRAFNNYSDCWKKKAAQSIPQFKKNTGYAVKFLKNFKGDVLGETWHPPFRREIRLSRKDIWEHAFEFKYNPWHLTMQTLIHEWVHAEVGRSSNIPWQRVLDEFDAQRKAYDRYIAVYHRQPPQGYNTIESIGLTQEDWDSKVSRYEALQSKVDDGETLLPEEKEELKQIKRDFNNYERQQVGDNPDYNYNHFDLCE